MPAAGVPLIVAVPLWLSVNITPEGSMPVSPITMDAPVGKPVVVTVKDWPVLPGWNVTLFALVICGGSLVVMMKLCEALVSTPPFAVPPLSWITSVMVDEPVVLADGV